jgi:hypothetical protein
MAESRTLPDLVRRILVCPNGSRKDKVTWLLAARLPRGLVLRDKQLHSTA